MSNIEPELTGIAWLAKQQKRTKIIHQHLHEFPNVLVTYQSLSRLPAELDTYLALVAEDVLKKVDGTFSIDDTRLEIKSILKAQTEVHYGHP